MKKTAVLFFTLSFYSLSLTGITCEPDIINQVEGSPFAAPGVIPIEFHPTGKFFGVLGVNTITMFNVGLTGQLTQIEQFALGGGFNAGDLSFRPDGTLLAISNLAAAQIVTLLVNADGTLTLVGVFPIVGTTAGRLAFSPNGIFLANNSITNNLVTMFRISATGEATQLSSFTPGTDPVDLDFNFDGSLLAVLNRDSNSISMFNVGNDGFLTKIADTPITGGILPVAIAFHPKGNLLATVDAFSPSVSLFSVSSVGTLTQLPALPLEIGSTDLQFNPLGNLLAVSKRTSSNMNIFEITDNQKFSEAVGSPFSVNTPQRLDFSPGNNFLAVGSDGGDEFINAVTMFCIKRDLTGCGKALIDKYQPLCPIQ